LTLASIAIAATAETPPGASPSAAMSATHEAQPAGVMKENSFTPEQRLAIVEIVRNALRDDPSILREAIATLRTSEQRNREMAMQAAVAANADALFRDQADPVKGNARGSIVLVEFFDARCGYCKRVQPVIEQFLERNKDVRLVLKDLPVLGPNSEMASRALLAAQRQGKYEPLQAALLAVRGDLAEPVVQREAERVGIDWSQLQRDMQDPAIVARIQRNLQMANALQINGTPALVIGERVVVGAFDITRLEALVAEHREAQATNAAAENKTAAEKNTAAEKKTAAEKDTAVEKKTASR
jgi:protein-disulfide isomerase